MNKILVTGGCGLIGTELCEQLKDHNEVWVVDNHSRSSSVPEGVRYLEIDLMDTIILNMLPVDFDYIYHFSAINGTKNFYDMPNKVLENNLISDINMFKFAKNCVKLKKLVYASSSEIVADDPKNPEHTPENTDVYIKNIHNARWSYRIAKIASENYLANMKDVPILITRYFNVYGKNSKSGHFLADQIAKIRDNKFEIIGADETRSFCHVSDAARATIYCAEFLEENFCVVNIGNDKELTIKEATKIIAKEMGMANDTFDEIFTEIPGKEGSVKGRKPDISKLRNLYYTYNPMDFEEGVHEILKSLKEDWENS